nr:HlyC/CorC family transporter [Propionibacterium sp.]
MSPTVANILLIFLFILVGGIFAAAEMALVSLRDSQVRALSTRGKRGAAVAALAANPNRFLSAVQIGVTLSGFLSAAFGGATLAEDLEPVLRSVGVPAGVAGPLALVTITVVISYFSIVLGELASKRLAMQRAETVAMMLAPLVSVIARITRPVIWFLGVSTDFVVRVLGGDPAASREEVTDEELRQMVSSSATLGAEERQIVDEVFSAGDVSLREAMVPRTEVDFLDGDLPAYRAIAELAGKSHSRYPVVGRDVDDVIGFLHIRDLFDLDPSERQVPIAQLTRPIESLPQTVKILRALTFMRANNAHLVIVRDEYGGTAGIVTLEDLVEELIGDITDEFDQRSEASAAGTLRSGELDGLTTLEEFAEQFGHALPEGPYDTVAGFVMARLGRLPAVGDSVTAQLMPRDHPDGPPAEFGLTVTELDGRRASRIAVLAPEAPGRATPATGVG